MKRLSEDLEKNIINDYLNINSNIKSICNKYKISRDTIYKVLIRNNIKRKYIPSQLKYNIDLSFFKSIDTHEKAYFLGWLYSDGVMQEDNHSVHINIKESDKDILISLNQLIQSTLPLKIIQRQEDLLYNRQNLCKLSIHRKEIYNDLIKLGLHPNKTLTLELPNKKILPDLFFFSFLRGFLDGDGCIYNKNNKPMQTVSFTCNEKFALMLKLKLKLYGIDSNIFKKSNTEKVVDLKINKNNSVFKLLYLLYINSGSLKLTRKYNIFLDILKKYLSSKNKINYKTIDIFKKYKLYETFLNFKPNYKNHWKIDKRNY